MLIGLSFGGEWEEGEGVRSGVGPAFPASWAAAGGTQRLLKSSFFLLQSIFGARLLPRFWWALSLATAREMLKSGMGSEEEEEVDEGAVESSFLGLSWEFSCGREKTRAGVSAQGSQVTRTGRGSTRDLQGRPACQARVWPGSGAPATQRRSSAWPAYLLAGVAGGGSREGRPGVLGGHLGGGGFTAVLLAERGRVWVGGGGLGKS